MTDGSDGSWILISLDHRTNQAIGSGKSKKIRPVDSNFGSRRGIHAILGHLGPLADTTVNGK